MNQEQKALEHLKQAAEQLADAIYSSQEKSYQQDILLQVYTDTCKAIDRLSSYIED